MLKPLWRLEKQIAGHGLQDAEGGQKLRRDRRTDKFIARFFATFAKPLRPLRPVVRTRMPGRGRIAHHPEQVLHSTFVESIFHNPAHGRIVNIKGLRNLLHAVAVRGIGLDDGWVARWHRYKPG